MTERTERTVSQGGAALRVYERGGASADRPTIVLAHGWPDSHEVWDLVADRLEGQFHVVTFDARGVGASTAPRLPRAFALTALAADVAAVIEAVSPDRPAHLVGHDWGSIQGWEVVTDPAHAVGVASFTSVSGPSLDHTGALLRERLRQPSLGTVAAMVEQGSRSAYTVVLSTPGLNTVPWRLGFDRVFRRWLARSEGLPATDGYPGPGLAHDATAAAPMYRQNIFPRLLRPRPRPTQVPVQLIVNLEDPAVRPQLLDEVARWAPDLTRRELAAGHWSPRTHPDEVAALISEHVVAVETRPAREHAGAT